jgi:hypothetical protein
VVAENREVKVGEGAGGETLPPSAFVQIEADAMRHAETLISHDQGRCDEG